MYVVVLDATLHGSSVMTTDDVIEADLPADAEAKAIEQWTRTEQRFRFQPLLTMLQPDGDRGA